MPRFATDVPRGYAKKTLRDIRKRYDLKGSVDIHHVIPRQFAKHPVLKQYRYDTEADYNTIFAVTSSSSKLKVHEHRPRHSGGHMAYNKWVGDMLQRDTVMASFACFCLLLKACHAGSRGIKNVPWS